MTYTETITNLFTILRQANMATTDSADEWQAPKDANGGNGFHGKIDKAIELLAGREILNVFYECDEIDLSLCDRK
jgi:hypothetical protein